MIVSLQLGATTLEAPDWPAQGIVLRLQSLAADTLDLVLVADYDTALPFSVGDAAVLRVDGTVRFRGRVDRIAPSAAGRTEGIAVACVGPWSWLERIIYTQSWLAGNGVDDTTAAQSLSRIVIGQDDTGAKRTIAAELTAAVDAAIAQGADLALATVSLPVTIPYAELLDATVAEVLRTVLRWVPDAVSWFDYSTAPATLHIARRADLSSAGVAVTDSRQVAIHPRPDLQARGVVLAFESSYAYNGTSYAQVATQTAGETSGERIIRATIGLEGGGVTVEEQKVEVRAIAETAASWWRLHVPWLKDYPTADLTIASATVEEYDHETETWGASSLPSILISGAISDWMGKTTKRVRISAKVTYTGTNPALERLSSKLVSLEAIGTTATSKTYRRTTAAWVGESAPVGLAAAIYAAHSTLHYQGTLVLGDAAGCDFSLRPGLLLNITGGLTAWETMDAIVQAVRHDISAQVTTAELGPPEQLSPQAFADLVRANRTARASWRLTQRATGQTPGSSITVGGEIQPVKDQGAVPGGGASFRIKTGTLSMAGSFPTSAEITTALAGAYSGDTPAMGDIVILSAGGTPAFGFLVLTTALTASGLFCRSFVVSSSTYYAIGWQLGLF